jgi:hypothetical protein
MIPLSQATLALACLAGREASAGHTKPKLPTFNAILDITEAQVEPGPENDSDTHGRQAVVTEARTGARELKLLSSKTKIFAFSLKKNSMISSVKLSQ